MCSKLGSSQINPSSSILFNISNCFWHKHSFAVVNFWINHEWAESTRLKWLGNVLNHIHRIHEQVSITEMVHGLVQKPKYYRICHQKRERWPLEIRPFVLFYNSLLNTRPSRALTFAGNVCVYSLQNPFITTCAIAVAVVIAFGLYTCAIDLVWLFFYVNTSRGVSGTKQYRDL